jgi:hypothetical protein
MSEPQTAHASTFAKSSPSPHTGTGISSVRKSNCPWKTTALIFFLFIVFLLSIIFRCLFERLSFCQNNWLASTTNLKTTAVCDRQDCQNMRSLIEKFGVEQDDRDFGDFAQAFVVGEEDSAVLHRAEAQWFVWSACPTAAGRYSA